MEEEGRSSTVPPYVSFASFLSLLDWLKNDGVPAQLDRSAWDRKFSGSVGSQLMTALRYLKLLDGETPTSRLEKLASAEEGVRKELLKALLEEAYPTLFGGFELARATPKMVDEAFSKDGGSANTRRKAVAFFVNVCKFADVPLSSQVRNLARNRPAGSGTRTRKESNNRQESDSTNGRADASQQPVADQKASQSLRTLALSSGGSLTLTLDVNLFDLSRNDREFVMELVDRVQDYDTGDGKEEDVPEDFHSI